MTETDKLRSLYLEGVAIRVQQAARELQLENALDVAVQALSTIAYCEPPVGLRQIARDALGHQDVVAAREG